MTRARAVVLITEGLNPDLVERWGPDLLPAFHRLRRDGTGGVMRSEFVPYEPSGLITAFTGVGPGHHGTFSYWNVHSRDYVPAVRDSSSARRPLLWHRPELADRTVAVINVFGTHPVRPVNGHLISYPMRASTHACHPRDLPIRLAAHGLQPMHDVTVWFDGAGKEDFVPRVLRCDEVRAGAAIHLLDGGMGTPPDLVVLNLTGIDRLSHFYWQELEPDSPVPLDDLAVLKAYQLADRTLGVLLDRVDEHTSLLAFSEIGFGSLRAYCSVNQVLAEAGLLAYGDDGRPDWARTQAFEAVQGSHGVNINLVGRYRSGSVQPADYTAVLAETSKILTAHINPLTGLPMFADVLPRDRIYDGPALEDAPDLVVEPYDWRYLPCGDEWWAGRVNRRLQSGWHRRNSYWGGAGPAFAGSRGHPAELTDVAPTILHMLGRPVLDGMVGDSLGRRAGGMTNASTWERSSW